MAYNCPKKESTDRSNHKPVSTKMVSSTEIEILKEILDDPLQYLLSDLDDLSNEREVQIQDQGSKPGCGRSSHVGSN